MAQTDASEASFLVSQIISRTKEAYSVYNMTYATYHQAKTILQENLDRKTKANMIVDLASNDVNMADTVNDNAMKDMRES